MSSRTVFLSRLIGLYSIVVALAMAARRQATVDIVTALLHNQAALFLVGIVGVVIGLAMILGHNIWSGGAVPVIVTLVGWAALAKGLLFLFLTPEAATAFYLGALQYEHYFYVYLGFLLILGVYLTAASRARS